MKNQIKIPLTFREIGLLIDSLVLVDKVYGLDEEDQILIETLELEHKKLELSLFGK